MARRAIDRLGGVAGGLQVQLRMKYGRIARAWCRYVMSALPVSFMDNAGPMST